MMDDGLDDSLDTDLQFHIIQSLLTNELVYSYLKHQRVRPPPTRGASLSLSLYLHQGHAPTTPPTTTSSWRSTNEHKSSQGCA